MNAYILTVSFNDMQPTIWRQFIMPENATFKRLFDTIMNVTNFEGSHLFRFEAAELIVTNDEEMLKASKRKSYEGKPVKSATAKIDAHVQQGPIQLVYDFGDHWELTIALDRVVDDYYFGYPTLLAMEGVAPPESCGGIESYKQLVSTLQNASNPAFLKAHAQINQVAFIPRHFDEINERLKAIKYGKTDWSALKHDHYILLEDAYRRADIYSVDRIKDAAEIADYALACGNLYGFLPMHQFLAIYEAQHNVMITATDVRIVAESKQYAPRFANMHVTVYDNAIVHDDFEKAVNNETFFSRSFGKPYYVPSRNQLLHYADDTYIEETAAIQTLRKLVEQDLGGRSAKTEQLLQTLCKELRCELNFSDTVKRFIAHIPFKNTLQLNIYIELVTNVANSLRLWVNRGYTPTELSALEQGHVVQATAVAPAAKIGRNEPCVCGSGKKYKKCCGR